MKIRPAGAARIFIGVLAVGCAFDPGGATEGENTGGLGGAAAQAGGTPGTGGGAGARASGGKSGMPGTGSGGATGAMSTGGAGDTGGSTTGASSGGRVTGGGVSNGGTSSHTGGAGGNVTGGANAGSGGANANSGGTSPGTGGSITGNGGSSPGNGGAGTGGASATTVTLQWASPAANSTLTGTAELRLTGRAFVNVEVFQGSTMLARCSVAPDHASATCSLDSKRLPNGTVTLTAHAWDSAAGQTFMSDADAGSRSFTIANQTSSTSFWPSGTDGLSRTFADAFGAWRGRPTTSNWINVHWVTWDWMTNPGFYSTLDGTNPVKVWDLYAGWSGVMVLSMSMAGSSNDSSYDQRMRECANGDFDGYWNTFAQNAANAGRSGNDTVVSLAHEFNGTWFKWNPGTVGLDVWKSCWRHVYSAIHAKSSLRVAWVFSASSNTTKGGDYSVNTAWDAYPGDDYVDIVGINRYDFRSLSSNTTTNWRDTCNNTQDICYAANYARQHGKPIGVPEWSMDRGQYGWGDLPAFVTMMFNFFKDNADILAFENNFNNGGSGDWNFYPENGSNMDSAERYKSLWKQ
jgi:hypothetical protein